MVLIVLIFSLRFNRIQTRSWHTSSWRSYKNWDLDRDFREALQINGAKFIAANAMDDMIRGDRSYIVPIGQSMDNLQACLS